MWAHMLVYHLLALAGFVCGLAKGNDRPGKGPTKAHSHNDLSNEDMHTRPTNMTLGLGAVERPRLD